MAHIKHLMSAGRMNLEQKEETKREIYRDGERPKSTYAFTTSSEQDFPRDLKVARDTGSLETTFSDPTLSKQSRQHSRTQLGAATGAATSQCHQFWSPHMFILIKLCENIILKRPQDKDTCKGKDLTIRPGIPWGHPGNCHRSL